MPAPYYTSKPYGDSVTSFNIVEEDGVVAVVGASLTTVTIFEVDSNGNIVRASGTTAPVDGDAGYGVGSTFFTLAGGTGSSFYINEGTSTSCNFNVVTTIDPNAGTTSIAVAHAIYSFATDGGAVGLITPALNVTIPANAIIVGASFNSTTAPVGAGATLAFGTSAGSTANSLLTATAITSFTLDAIVNGTVTFAAPRKLSASGGITMTVATAPLTAGVIEAFVYYTVAKNA